MQKKEIEKIPPLKAEKADSKFLAVAVSKRVQIKKEDYLIVDIFENKKKSFSQYIVRIVLNKKEFANYFPDGTWTEQKIRKRDYEFVWENKGKDISAYRVYMSPEHTKVVRDAIHKLDINMQLSDDWYSNILNYEDRQTDRRQCIAQTSKEKACRERNAIVKPAPDEFIEWAKSRHTLGYIYYQRKGKMAEFTCSKCGKTYVRKCVRGESYEESFENVVEIPRRNEKAVCSLCEAEGIYKNKGKYIKGVYSQIITAYLIQPHTGDAAVIRQYAVEKIIRVGSPESYIITEYGRYFIGSHIQQRDWNMETWDIEQRRYIREWTYKNNQGYNYWTDEEGQLWPGSSIDSTFLKYSQIISYSQRVPVFKPTYFAEAYKKYPDLEIIIKLGMDKLADELVKSYQFLKIYEGSSVEERLGIRKGDMKSLIREKGDWEYIRVLRLEKEKNLLLKEDERQKLKNHIAKLEGNALNTALEYMTVRKFINIIEKYSGCSMRNYCSGAYERTEHIITTYLDYLSMRKTLHNDLDNSVFLYPRRISEAHAAMVRESDQKKTETYIKQREERYSHIREYFEEYMKKYYRESGELFIRPAMSAEEIILEGRRQHHCVGGDNYLEKHNEGKSVILFLRYKNSPETPYVTVEIKDNTIIQWYSAHDQKLDEEQNDKWLAAYVRRLKTASGKPLSDNWKQAADMVINPEACIEEKREPEKEILSLGA